MKTVDPESQHGTRYGVGVGSGCVVLIEIGFPGPETNPPARKARIMALAAPWITHPENCGSKKPTWNQVWGGGWVWLCSADGNQLFWTLNQSTS